MELNVSDKFKDWYRKYDDVEKCRLIKEKSIVLNNAHKDMVRAVETEQKSGFNRVGMRGGTFTSLAARAANKTDIYLKLLDEFKYMVITL